MRAFLFVILWCVFILHAQEGVRLTEDEYSALRADILDNYAKYPIDAVSRAEEYLRLYESKFTPRQQLRMYYTKAYFQIEAELFEDAYATLVVCKQLADKVNDPNLTYYYFAYMAGMLNTLENFDLSAEAYTLALETANKSADQAMIARTYNNIGHALISLGQYEKARPNIDKFYQYGIDNEVPAYIATGLNNFGEIEFGLGNIEQAKVFFEQSLKIRQEQKLQLSSSWSYFNLGRVYSAVGDFEKAQENLEEAIKIRKFQERELEAIRAQIELVKVHFGLNQHDKAYTLLQLIIPKLIEKRNLGLLSQAYTLLKRYYLDKQIYEKAIDASEKNEETKTAYMRRKADVALAHHLAKMELNIKELENSALKKEKELTEQQVASKQQQIVISIILSLIILIITLIYLSTLSRKNRRLKSTIEALAQTRVELIEAEKMSALTTLVSGMAHQLNTPVGVVVTANSVIKDKLQALKKKLHDRSLNQKFLEDSMEAMHETLALSEQSCNKTAELIQRFKLISTELEEAEVTEFKLKSFTQEKLKLITSQQPAIKNYQVNGDEIVVRHYPNALFRVLEQLIKNTAENAIDGNENLSVVVTITNQKNSLMLEYADNGSGIPKEIKDKIFEPFFTTKGMQKSLGLGLNIAYNSVMHLMNGKLSCIDSEVGAKFVLQLPIAANEAPLPLV